MSLLARPTRPDARAVPGIILLGLLLLLGSGPAARAQDSVPQLTAEQTTRFAGQAAAWRQQLSAQVMPFWHDRTLDPEQGGYLLRESGTSDKLLVSQARLLWEFAYAHRLGVRDPQRDYLAAAASGYRFLRTYFRDTLHGGYYWMTNRAGRPLNERKFLYGQACMLAALVEYYRASGDAAALQDALDLYGTLMERARDPVNGGWTEHFEADWQPLSGTGTGAAGTGAGSTTSRPLASQQLIIDPATVVDVGIVGTKSGEAHLELMAALTELLLVSREAAVPAAAPGPAIEDALAEALDLNLKYFFPQHPGQAYPYREPDWQRPLGAKFREISYGENVEFAWLMLAAQAALGRDPLWPRFDAILQHALKYGFDDKRGGLYAIGFGDRPALATEKVWWAQAEMLAALTTGVQQRADPERVQALEQLVSFVTTYQTDPRDGIWFEAVKADGLQWRPGKANHWKTGFNDLRAMELFVETFGAG
jgi:mannobiose 2-epimerase